MMNLEMVMQELEALGKKENAPIQWRTGAAFWRGAGVG
jgi:hypothetical protein